MKLKSLTLEKPRARLGNISLLNSNQINLKNCDSLEQVGPFAAATKAGKTVLIPLHGILFCEPVAATKESEDSNGARDKEQKPVGKRKPGRPKGNKKSPGRNKADPKAVS